MHPAFPPPAQPGPASLRWHALSVSVRDLGHRAADGLLVPAGRRSGPSWTVDRQADLFTSLEFGWPIGTLTAWAPTALEAGRWHLLDGHRRLRSLTALLPTTTPTLIRDLSTDTPTWLPADRHPGHGHYLPADAFLYTLRFLAATRGMPADVVRRAETAAMLITTQVPVILLTGGTPHTVTELCARLLPGRVGARVPARIAATP